MAKITYVGTDTRQDGTVLWHGHVFKPNVAVSTDHPELLAAAEGNPYFEISGKKASAPASEPNADDRGGGQNDADDATGEDFGAYSVKRRRGGKYAVVKGDEVLADGLLKEEAETHARDLATADAATSRNG